VVLVTWRRRTVPPRLPWTRVNALGALPCRWQMSY